MKRLLYTLIFFAITLCATASDVKVKIVDSFEDIKIKIVDSFEGVKH